MNKSYLAFALAITVGCGGGSESGPVESAVEEKSDLPFGPNQDGKVVTPIGASNDTCMAIAAQTDGKIVAVGYSFNGSNMDVAVVRYTSDGLLDASFDSDGIVTTPVGASNDYGVAVALQPDGKIVVAGYSHNGTNYDVLVLRYNSDGSLDTGFDGDGKVLTAVTTSTDYGRDVALQSDGKIVVVGNSYDGSKYGFTLVRYNSDGSLDTGFSSDGKLLTRVGTSHSYARDLVVQPDGRIVVAGYAYNGTTYDFALARYSESGDLDTAFGSQGTVLTPIGTKSDYAREVALQSDGKIVVAGYAYNGTNYDFAVARYDSDGTLDTTFDADGFALTPLGGGHDYGRAVALQPDGKVVVGGHAHNGTNADFAAVRYEATGALDLAFDTDGMTTVAVGAGEDHARSVVVLPNGKILLGGYAHNGADFDFAVVRFD